MSLKKKNRQSASGSQLKTGKRLFEPKSAIVLVALLFLVTALGAFAQMRAAKSNLLPTWLGGSASATTGIFTRSSTQTSAPVFPASNPSREYIYASGKQIATVDAGATGYSVRRPSNNDWSLTDQDGKLAVNKPLFDLGEITKVAAR